MKLKRIMAMVLCVAMVLSTMSFSVFAEDATVAKVGNTEYATIDEAITAWTNGTTLTLLANVTLSDVITLKSTEHHILDLGIYTMTAASKKDAIQIENNGRTSASYALDIKADASIPGGITATGKAVVRTNGKSGVKDRPIIRFYGGVFNASYIVYHSGSNGTNCPQFQFHGGEFNGTIYTNRALNQFYGGTFNGSLMMSVDSSAYTLINGGTFKQLSNLYMSALNSDKFTIGSSKGKYDREVYVDDEGYYVVGVAEPTESIEAAVAKTPGTNDYLKYSKVGTEGNLNYTDVYVALDNNASAKVTVYSDTLDLTGSKFKGTIVVPEGEEITIIVEEGTNPTWSVPDGAAVTYTDAEGNVLEKDESGSFVDSAPAGPAWEGEGTSEAPYLIEDVAGLKAFQASVNSGEVYDKVYFKLKNDIDLAAGAVSPLSDGVTSNWEPIGTKEKPFKGTFDGDGKTISNLIVVGEANQGFIGYADMATIKNINIKNATVIGTDCVGAIAGQVYSSSLIDNCHVSGNIQITGQTNVGGIVGKYYTKVNNSSVIGDGTSTSFVKGVYTVSNLEGDNVGGIMGHGGENNNFVGNIVKNITVSGTRKIGGIVGTTDRATDVSSCVVENVILETTATEDYAADNAGSMALGGLIGHYYGNSTGGTVNDSTVQDISFVKENNVPVHAGAIVGNNRTTPNDPVEGVTFGDNIVVSVTGATNNYLQPTVTYVAEVNSIQYESLEDAVKAAQAGDTITLLADITMTADAAYAMNFSHKAVNIDGKGHKITQAADCDIDWALLYYQDSAPVTIKNLTFDGIKGGAAIWAINADINVENCVFQNGEHTQIQGFVRTTGSDATIKDSKFLNNRCNMIITFNFDLDASAASVDTLKVQDCEFKGNTCADTATIYFVKGASSEISGNIFDNNTVDTTSHGAIAYYSEGQNGVVTNNVFSNNTVKAASARAGVLILEAGTNVSENGFVSNNVSSTASGDTFVGTVVNKADVDSEGVTVSGNYWGGNEPDVANVNGAPTALDNYYTTYVDGELGGLVATATPVASVDGVEYITLDDAVDAANTGDTVKIIKDAGINAAVTVSGKSITVDLDGKNITTTANTAFVIASDAELTVKDSSAEAKGKITAGSGTKGNAIDVEGKFTLESGNIYSYNNAIYSGNADSEIVINGGTITARPETNNSAVMYLATGGNVVVNDGTLIGYNGILMWNHKNLTINGGKITATGSAAIQGNGTWDTTDIVINDGEISGYYTAIYHPQGGKLTINGGSLTGWTGVVVKGGTIKITDGTISGTGAYNAYKPVSSGYVDTGDGLYVENYDNSPNSENYGPVSIEITGGTFTSVNGSAVGSYANPNNEVTAPAGFISGGSFSNKPDDKLVADGFEFVEKADGSFGVAEEINNVASVNGVGYETLEAALEAATDGDTVVLLTDIELSDALTIPAGKTVTLDLNGKTISGTDNATGSFALIEIQPGAALTIDDTVGTGKITLTATNNRDWNAYSSVISNQRGKLTIESGTIEHLGGTDMAYGIDNLTNGKGTYAETIVDGGTIKSPYRAVRQFLNGVEAQNILTVNGGTIEGANKSIWMQDPSANANSGTLAVAEGANLIGDVYLSVTEGSTEWPVAVNIAAAALNGNSTILTNDHVPEGYKVALENGYYGVKEEEVKANPFKDSLLFLAGLPDETVDGVTYHPVYVATSIDSLNYRKVGFDYTFSIFEPDTKEVTFTAPVTTDTRDVYSSISDATTEYTVNSIGGNGEYLFMNKLVFDARYYHNNNTKFTITPYAIDMDGNKITGWTMEMSNEFYKSLQLGNVKQDMFKEEN